MAKKYKYPKNWFKYNLMAIPTGSAGGACSACLFHNIAPQFCGRVACAYVNTENIIDIESVYWIARDAHADIMPELQKFFETTPKQRTRQISLDILTKAVLAARSKKK